MMDKASTKRTILGALIITMSLIIMGISGSYAYFTNSVEKKENSDPGFSLTSGDLTMTFLTTDYIKGTNVSLINADDYKTSGESSTFSIQLPDSDNVVDSAKYTIYLTGIKMTQNMKSTYLKWALHKSGVEKAVNSGHFGSVSLAESQNSDNTYNVTSTFNLYENATINKGTTDTYTLYVWLENDPNENQNSLLEGQLEFKVGFTATNNKQ